MANKKDTAGAKGAPATKKTAAKQATGASAIRAAEIAKQHGVDTVYENPQGKFFTVENLAMLSVGRDKKQLTIHRPALIKGQEPVIPAEDSEGSEDGDGGEGDGTGDENGDGNKPPAE
jgi:hypothetical protein